MVELNSLMTKLHKLLCNRVKNVFEIHEIGDWVLQNNLRVKSHFEMGIIVIGFTVAPVHRMTLYDKQFSRYWQKQF